MIDYFKDRGHDRAVFFDEVEKIKGAELVVLEPGDSTRYEFMVYVLNKRTVVIANYNENRSWKIVGSAVPHDFQQSTYEHTQCILADIANTILKVELDCFYDWERGRPVEFARAL